MSVSLEFVSPKAEDALAKLNWVDGFLSARSSLGPEDIRLIQDVIGLVIHGRMIYNNSTDDKEMK